jgi:vacuolar-type H+-ATPase subunit E/Vma4
MTVTDPDSSEALCNEILAGAGRERDEIVQRATRDSDDLLKKAHAGADSARQKRIEEARAEGNRLKDITLASASVEARRLRLERIETLLDSVREDVIKKLSALRSDGDYSDIIVDLAASAIEGMAGNDFTVRLSEEERSVLGTDIGRRIAEKAGCPDGNVKVLFEPTSHGGGPVIEDATGTQVWDNRFPVRLERLWPQFRRLIAEKMFPDMKTGN